MNHASFRLLRWFFCALILLSVLAADGSDKPPGRQSRLSVLIVDGMNNHDWPRATKILKAILEGSGLFAVDVSTSPPANAPNEAWDKWRPAFSRYDVVLSNFNGGHTSSSRHWPREVEKALEDYVRGGGGLVIYHSANNSVPNWPAYNEMIGLGWRDKGFGQGLTVSPQEKVIEIPRGEGRNPGHGPEHDFTVTVLNQDHPITKGVPKQWRHPHEQLTHGQHGPAKNLTVLSYAFSKDTRENEVMEWVLPYGKGRVFVTMLGHLWKGGPDTAMRCVGFRTMLIRGCKWAATGQVTYPVPTNFPTAQEVKLISGSSDGQPVFEVASKKVEDRITVDLKDGTTICTVTSPRGIGGGTISLTRGRWPDVFVLRLHLKGLESFRVSNGKVKLAAAVSSHNEGQKVRVWKDDKEETSLDEKSPFWTDIRIVGKDGKPAREIPLKDGYFEITLPKAFFEGKPKSITLNWIDFYR